MTKTKTQQRFDWPKVFYKSSLRKTKDGKILLDAEKVKLTLKKYCALRGWDFGTFSPGQDTIKRLNLDKLS